MHVKLVLVMLDLQIAIICHMMDVKSIPIPISIIVFSAATFVLAEEVPNMLRVPLVKMEIA